MKRQTTQTKNQPTTQRTRPIPTLTKTPTMKQLQSVHVIRGHLHEPYYYIKLICAEELAGALGVSMKTVNKWMDEGRLPRPDYDGEGGRYCTRWQLVTLLKWLITK